MHFHDAMTVDELENFIWYWEEGMERDVDTQYVDESLTHLSILGAWIWCVMGKIKTYIGRGW